MSGSEFYTENVMRELRSKYAALSLEQLRELPEAQPFDAGVYFLWLNDELQYIGKAGHILTRLAYQEGVNKAWPHHESPSAVYIPFDRHTALVLDRGRYRAVDTDERCQEMERLYIGTYPTPNNDPIFHAFT